MKMILSYFFNATAEGEVIVDGLNLQEIENDILGRYEGDLEMVADLFIGENFGKTHMRFRNISDYEASFNAIFITYDSEDSIVTSVVF